MLICLFVIMASFIFILTSLQYSHLQKLSGRAVTGDISIFIEGGGLSVSIQSPQNTTYNFLAGQSINLSLNTTATFVVDKWWYKLEDLYHGTVVNESVFFTPNTTFIGVRRSNRLTVYANDSSNSNASASVIYFVSVPNSSPILGNISNDILICENRALDYDFNATDVDEDNLTVDLSPKNPFFVTPTSFSGSTFIESEIFSGNLTKSKVGVYAETVSVSDGSLIDTKNTNITVIEVNNAPAVSNIGSQTAYTQGDNRTFYKQVEVSDIESGNHTSGNFSYNLTFLQGTAFFNISNSGVINVTVNSSNVGVHNLSVCVTDQALLSPHQNISICGQTGTNRTTCQNFSLTVTNENRAPTITSNYPIGLTFSSLSTENLFFNISKHDPDGTIPDAYWYVDGIFNELDSGSSADNFTHSFGCGISGVHTVKVDITDGLLNDSLQWNITLTSVTCSAGTGGGGGGGSGSGRLCLPKWACNEWQLCQNIEKSLESGIISGEDYRIIKQTCLNSKWLGDSCGFQIKSCFDIYSCEINTGRPEALRACYYTESPTCYDSIKNCHDGRCELLIDCGGPCNACSTCSDGIQNQGERGIDCSGPCPFLCEPEQPWYKIIWIKWMLMLIILLLLLIILYELYRIHRLRRRLNKDQYNYKN